MQVSAPKELCHSKKYNLNNWLESAGVALSNRFLNKADCFPKPKRCDSIGTNCIENQIKGFNKNVPINHFLQNFQNLW